MPFFHPRPLPSIRSKLITLVLACAFPILIGYLAFARDAAHREREHIAQDALTVAQALSAAVERDLASTETAARVLANAPALAAGDLAGFHERTRQLLRPDFPVSAFELSDVDGTPLLSSRAPYGKPVPADGNEAQVRRVAASGDALIAGLYRADPSQPYLVSIDVPVWRAGKVAYVLSVQRRPGRMGELLAGQRLPPHWSAQVYDSQDLLVERSGGPSSDLGAPMPAALAARAARTDTGLVGSIAGGAISAAYARTPARRWTVAVTYPAAAARDMLGHSALAIGASALALLAVSLGLAWAIGGSIGRSVRALTGPAAALGRGEPVQIPQLALREAAAVADALREVEGELSGYRNGLEALVAARTDDLAHSNALLETIYATAPVGLCFMDRDLRFVMVNDYLAALNGVPAAAHVGRTLSELLGAAGTPIEAAYRRVIATGRPLVGVEATVAAPSAPDDERHWIASYYPVWGAQRELAGINAVVLDITERKLHEQRDRDNQELFRVLYEASSDAHMLADASFDSRFVSANRAAARLFGCASIDEFLALSPLAISAELQPDGRRSEELAPALMQEAVATGAAHFEWLLKRPDGSTFNADVVLTKVDLGGKLMLQATVRDISERVAAEAAVRAAGARLAQRERFIRTVTDNLPALVAYWDAGHRLRFANRTYLDWLNCGDTDPIGQHARQLLGEERLNRVAPHLAAVLAGEPQGFELDLHRAAGETIRAWANYIPDVDEEGTVRGFYMLMADITELKRTESRLVQALHAAEQGSRAKGEFVANMSHEIRTPMNAILGLARLLEEAQLGRRERGYVTRMQAATRSLLAMLNDVLDFSRIESGQLSLEQTPFRLDDVLDNVSVLGAANAWAKGIEPVFAVAPGVPALLAGDPMRLQQVLLNLVGNAVKFTDRGEVVLSVGVRQHGGTRATLAFAVRDTGIGIAPGKQELLFEAFSQADSSTSRKYGGAGLGLSIARRLVALMGGTLRVQSTPGEGAEFSFELAFSLPAEDAPSLPVAPLSVLVADDNASSCAALADACAGLGWQVARAHGGAEALALLRSVRFDLALLDATMPGFDGATLIRHAREGAAGPAPRCVLLAADPERKRRAAAAAGVATDAILAKPFTPRALLAAATGAADSAAAPAPLRAVPLRARLDGMRVLLVEDNLINQEVAGYILGHAGAHFDVAGNGAEALAMLAEERRYDVVLMDLQMPVMDGVEAATAIRALGLAELPIVAMTANALDEDRRRSMEAGMDAHLAKPIDVDELVATLARLTGRAGAPAAPRPAAAAPAPTLPGIAVESALTRFGGNFENFAALLRRLPASQGSAIGEIRALLARGDRAGAQQVAHRLCGVAANLGADEVAALARVVEQSLRAGAAEALEPGLARLEAALRVVLDGVRALGEPAPTVAAHATPLRRTDLAQLLEFLRANNLQAQAQFEAIRPALAEPHAAPLAEAIATLRFDHAAQLVRQLLEAEETE